MTPARGEEHRIADWSHEFVQMKQDIIQLKHNIHEMRKMVVVDRNYVLLVACVACMLGMVIVAVMCKGNCMNCDSD